MARPFECYRNNSATGALLVGRELVLKHDVLSEGCGEVRDPVLRYGLCDLKLPSIIAKRI